MRTFVAEPMDLVKRIFANLYSNACFKISLKGKVHIGYWIIDAVASYRIENFSCKWELPTCTHPPSIAPLLWWKERGKIEALISIKHFHFYRTLRYSKIHSKNSLFENSFIWKASTKSCDHPHVIPLWVQMMVQYTVCGEPLKSYVFHWSAVEKLRLS